MKLPERARVLGERTPPATPTYSPPPPIDVAEGGVRGGGVQTDTQTRPPPCPPSVDCRDCGISPRTADTAQPTTGGQVAGVGQVEARPPHSVACSRRAPPHRHPLALAAKRLTWGGGRAAPTHTPARPRRAGGRGRPSRHGPAPEGQFGATVMGPLVRGLCEQARGGRTEARVVGGVAGEGDRSGQGQGRITIFAANPEKYYEKIRRGWGVLCLSSEVGSRREEPLHVLLCSKKVTPKNGKHYKSYREITEIMKKYGLHLSLGSPRGAAAQQSVRHASVRPGKTRVGGGGGALGAFVLLLDRTESRRPRCLPKGRASGGGALGPSSVLSRRLGTRGRVGVGRRTRDGVEEVPTAFWRGEAGQRPPRLRGLDDEG